MAKKVRPNTRFATCIGILCPDCASKLCAKGFTVTRLPEYPIGLELICENCTGQNLSQKR